MHLYVYMKKRSYNEIIEVFLWLVALQAIDFFFPSWYYLIVLVI